jgi:hypothetical protein
MNLTPDRICWLAAIVGTIAAPVNMLGLCVALHLGSRPWAVVEAVAFVGGAWGAIVAIDELKERCVTRFWAQMKELHDPRIGARESEE